jgi:hypothetical protein
MRDTYSGGYKKAVLDLCNFLQPDSIQAKTCKSKKQYQAMVLSMLELLLHDGIALYDFMETGGDCWVKQTPDGKILSVSREKEGLR